MLSLYTKRRIKEAINNREGTHIELAEKFEIGVITIERIAADKNPDLLRHRCPGCGELARQESNDLGGLGLGGGDYVS